MKKTLAILLCVLFVLTSAVLFASCSNKNKNENENEKTTTTTTEPAEIISGGWEKAESPVITDDVKKLLKKATETLDGAEYTPIAYVASQIVAGTNHCILCKVSPVVQNPDEKYVLVYIYEDLEGNAEITDVVDTNVSASYPENDGGWSEAKTPIMTDDAKAALDKATETLTGAEYTPVALLATQVVAGTNYSIFCQSKATVPNAETKYVIVTVFADLDGNAEITQTTEI